MRCNNCNHKISDRTQKYCPKCGHIMPPSKVKRRTSMGSTRNITCQYCNQETSARSKYCEHCGAITGAKKEDYGVNVSSYEALDEPTEADEYIAPESPSSRTVATLLVFFFGVFGIHSMYLGNYSKGLTQFFLGFISLIIPPLLFIPVSWAIYDFARLLTGRVKYDYYDRRLKP